MNPSSPAETPRREALFVDSTSLLGNPQALRRRAQEEGYLFFRGLLPQSDLLDLRGELLEVVERHGWRKLGQDRLGGTMDLERLALLPESQLRTDIGVSIAAYQDAQRLERLHRLPHHPRLLELYSTLLKGDVLVHPRHIARMITGHPAMVPTPPHQDFPLIQGTAQTWTAWFPLGDCPRELGGLTVLRGSHRQGYVPIQPSLGAGNIAVQLCDFETDWVEGDFFCGDVLTFPSHTIHKALKCQKREQIRLSMDVRYQSADEPIEQKSLRPHCELSWEQIYADWQQDDLKYYWRKGELALSPWEDHYLQPSSRIC